VSASRRFQAAKQAYIYPVLDYIEDEGKAKYLLHYFRDVYYHCSTHYGHMRNDARSDLRDPDHIPLGVKKEDARLVVPISYATERSWWINVRALRDFFRLRLAADAEWEIRRLAWMMYDLVSELLPSLFKDLINEPKTITRWADGSFRDRMFDLLHRNKTV
jgi:flavin-dependent thymidylate synthase